MRIRNLEIKGLHDKVHRFTFDCYGTIESNDEQKRKELMNILKGMCEHLKPNGRDIVEFLPKNRSEIVDITLTFSRDVLSQQERYRIKIAPNDDVLYEEVYCFETRRSYIRETVLKIEGEELIYVYSGDNFDKELETKRSDYFKQHKVKGKSYYRTFIKNISGKRNVDNDFPEFVEEVRFISASDLPELLENKDPEFWVNKELFVNSNRVLLNAYRRFNRYAKTYIDKAVAKQLKYLQAVVTDYSANERNYFIERDKNDPKYLDDELAGVLLLACAAVATSQKKETYIVEDIDKIIPEKYLGVFMGCLDTHRNHSWIIGSAPEGFEEKMHERYREVW